MRAIIIVLEQNDAGKYRVQRYDTFPQARAFIRNAVKSGGKVLGPFQVKKTPAEVAAELALQTCRSLDYAYYLGKKRGVSVDWAYLDEAHAEAVKAVRAANRAAKKETI